MEGTIRGTNQLSKQNGTLQCSSQLQEEPSSGSLGQAAAIPISFNEGGATQYHDRSPDPNAGRYWIHLGLFWRRLGAKTNRTQGIQGAIFQLRCPLQLSRESSTRHVGQVSTASIQTTHGWTPFQHEYREDSNPGKLGLSMGITIFQEAQGSARTRGCGSRRCGSSEADCAYAIPCSDGKTLANRCHDFATSNPGTTTIAIAGPAAVPTSSATATPRAFWYEWCCSALATRALIVCRSAYIQCFSS
mmetsp:Transcript_155/g.421  ORF Transcript_155/g.421 Transcript_155/m.421 type:complete len:246 (+) Transcript_155:567-1304(+)